MDILLLATAFKVQNLPSNSVYQVLIGKRTATTLFFAFSNKLTGFFGLYPKLQKAVWASYTENVSDYVSVEAIFRQAKQDDYMQLLFKEILPKREGLIIANHHHKQHLAFKLLLQVLSNDQANIHNYSPIVQDLEVQQFIKTFILMVKNTTDSQSDLSTLAYSLKKQLAKDLTAFPDQAALLFLAQFEGAHIPAQTLDQVAESHQISKRAVVISQQAVMDQVFQKWISGESLEPDTLWLQVFSQGIFRQFPVWNQTTQVTLDMLNQTRSLSQIAERRRLKLSTITEHIIEIALSNSAIIEPLVTEALGLTDITKLINHKPDATYEDFKNRFGEKDYWLYRYWHIVYQKGGDNDV